jgi:hypothetical protein
MFSDSNEPDNTTHVGRRARRVATIHDMTKKLGRVLPRPSAVFHVYASVDTPWVSQTPFHYTSVKCGKVSHYTSVKFGDFICHVCASTFQMLVQHGSTDVGLNRHMRGYHLEAPNIRSYHSPYLPSSILYFLLISPPDLQLCQPFDHIAKPHRTSIDRKGPIASGFQPLIFYR